MSFDRAVSNPVSDSRYSFTFSAGRVSRPLQSRRQVIYPHDGCVFSGVLSLAPGDVLEVEQAGGEWWKGKIVTSGDKTHPLQTGFFYSNFTVPVEPNKQLAVPCVASNVGGTNLFEAGHSVTYEENDYISQSPPSNDMSCIICHRLASQPHQTTCCGQTVCRICAETWKKTNNSCPQCRKAPLNLSIDVRMERNIANLNVHCRNHSKGCDWTGRLGDVTSHLKNSCQIAMMKCEHRGCSMEFLRSYLQKHRSSECKQRAVQCPCCGKKRKVYEQDKPLVRSLFATVSTDLRTADLTYNELVTEHYKVCPDWPMRCRNKCRQNNLTRASLQAHLDEACPEQVISCQFSEVGCRVRVKRREMNKHLLKAVGQHMADMMGDHMQLKKEHAVLMKEHAVLMKEHAVLMKEHVALKKKS